MVSSEAVLQFVFVASRIWRKGPRVAPWARGAGRRARGAGRGPFMFCALGGVSGAAPAAPAMESTSESFIL